MTQKKKIQPLKKIQPTKGAKNYTEKDWENSTFWENWAQHKVIKLSKNTLSVERAGFGTGIPGGVEDHRSDEEMANAPFDFTVKKDDVEIAQLEVSGDTQYTYDESRVILTRADKPERAVKKPVPCFMIYVLTQEPNHPKPLWLPFETIIAKGIKRTTYNRKIGEDQTNYWVTKEVWNIGLESLVSTLLGL